jgi:integrase
LSKLLPSLPKSKRTVHHAALHYSDVPEFMKKLRKLDGTAPRALEAVVLTASRVSEICGAKWPEVDFKSRLWIIPGSRTKSGREHRVPLTEDAVKVFKSMQARKLNDFVFPGRSDNKPLTTAACLKLVRDLGYKVTVHGFRSSFRDWAAEQTNFPRELQEAALSHVVGDQTERAYARGDLLTKRALMMEDWAKYCRSQKPTAKVTPIGRKRKAG